MMNTVFKDELARVTAMVGNELNSDTFPEEVRPSVLGAAVRDYPCRGGKRLRPALVLWACELFGGVCVPAFALACAVSCAWHSISGTLLAGWFVRRDEKEESAAVSLG